MDANALQILILILMLPFNTTLARPWWSTSPPRETDTTHRTTEKSLCLALSTFVSSNSITSVSLLHHCLYYPISALFNCFTLFPLNCERHVKLLLEKTQHFLVLLLNNKTLNEMLIGGLLLWRTYRKPRL